MFNRLDYLKIFCTTIRHKTFKDAAIELNVSPQVITRCIKELEAELGEILFVRSTRSIKVSTFGLQFYEKAKATLNLIDEMFAPHVNDNLPVRITAPAVICRLFVMPLIEKISLANPEIHFDVRPSDAISDVVESQIDIGIRVGSQLTSNRFIGRSLAKIRHVIVATPALIAKHGIPETPDDLHRLPTTLLMDKNKNQPWPWFFTDHPSLIPANPAFTTDSGESEFAAVRAGLGFGQLAIFMAAPYIKNGELIPVLQSFEEKSGELDLFLYRPQSGPVPHRTRLVYDAFVEHFSSPDFFFTQY
ncbi:LysR family transcriptional regulator [Tolumonas osonensis]|uniref:DNA-binding transcriptional LysR family regulator n=1 Tax=Tolumonas osonensis TaxID=675874 RepID=A0A841GDK8_9GAMM|nr:LysR family transcriptional regulator [Tolumonas osonensis]MBB6054696.1 DNA-binding transcriptional LysR family regulator [Tolumonas osonensis]